MYSKITIITTSIFLISSVRSQDANCDFLQTVSVGVVYNLSSPGYPGSYPAGVQCRWTAVCPTGYNCRLLCRSIEIPQTTSCSLDRLLVSRIGDPQLTAADVYCGRGSLTVVSLEQRITIGLIVARNTTGGRFLCQMVAQPASLPGRCQCGYKKATRIVGGEETGVNEFPMMAGLVNVEKSEIDCGGTIISNRYVLTAAHCLQTLKTISNVVVLVGEHNISDSESNFTRGYKANRLIIHPKFTESNYDYDIGLVDVMGPIEFNPGVGPACLPFKFVQTTFTGAQVILSGWGTLFTGGPTSKVLRKVTVDVISIAQCRENVTDLSDRQMCTLTPGKDACQYDSGGPVLYTDQTTGRLFIVGIVSYGRFCASRDPAINTRVTALLDWIVNTTQENFCIA